MSVHVGLVANRARYGIGAILLYASVILAAYQANAPLRRSRRGYHIGVSSIAVIER